MIAYDLHVHTCLSPSADDDMTPAKVIEKAVAGGLDIIAIADQNSIENLEAAAECAEDRIAFVYGIEVESSEEVHVLCLFPNLQGARRMATIVYKNMYDKKNKPKSFGNQLIVDEFDEVIEQETRMLKLPTKMTIEEIFYAARQMKGVALFAHIESKNYSVLNVLGGLPARPVAKALECTNNESGRKFARENSGRYNKPIFFSSDAHKLSDINTKENSDDLEKFSEYLRDEDGEITAKAFIEWLRSYEGI